MAALVLVLGSMVNSYGFVHIPTAFGTFGATLAMVLFGLISLIVLSIVRKERAHYRQFLRAYVNYIQQFETTSVPGYVRDGS
jgi:hypothetical protein